MNTDMNNKNFEDLKQFVDKSERLYDSISSMDRFGFHNTETASLCINKGAPYYHKTCELEQIVKLIGKDRFLVLVGEFQLKLKNELQYIKLKNDKDITDYEVTKTNKTQIK